MNDIRVIRHLDSDTLHLPELLPLIGRDVEIIVRERGNAIAAAAKEFGNPPTLDELAARQGITGPPPTFEQLTGMGLEDAFDGFDETLESWRKEPWQGAARAEGDGTDDRGERA